MKIIIDMVVDWWVDLGLDGVELVDDDEHVDGHRNGEDECSYCRVGDSAHIDRLEECALATGRAVEEIGIKDATKDDNEGAEQF